MLHCIAIDDEPLALMIITQYCERYGDISLTTFTNPVEGMARVKADMPDVVLLDIEMGGVNGVELARELPSGVCLIFTTAYAQFAIDGFELNATDYLHKPFSYTRFTKALDRVSESVKMRANTNDDNITLKVEYQSVIVPRSDIVYIESMDNYVRVYLSNSRRVLSQMSLKVMEEMLPEDQFMRVHKSYIIPRQSIASYSKSQIELRRDGVVIPIGRTYQAQFIRWIEG